MSADAVAALVHPRTFFERRTRLSLWPGALVVAVAWLLSGLTAAALVAQFHELIPRRELAIALVVILTVLPALGLVGWVVLAALLYALSWPLAEEGSFRDLLAATGWGWLPHVVKGTVVLAATVAVVSQLTPPSDAEATRVFARQLDSGSLVSVAAAAGTATATVSGSLPQVQAVVGVAATLWSGYVWMAAVETVRGLSRRQALAVVALPVLLMVLDNGL